MVVPQILGYRILKRTREAKAAPLTHPLILMRGLGRSSRFWLGFEKSLQNYADVVLLDLLGTGSSPSKWGRLTVEQHAQDASHTLKKILPEWQTSPGKPMACHLVGISFGSMVCMKLAELLGKQALCATFISGSARFTGYPRIKPRAFLDLLLSLRHSQPKHLEFAHHLVSFEYLKKNPELPKIWDQIYDEEGFTKVATLAQLAAAGIFEGKKTLEALAQPTFFVASRGDGLVDWRNSVAMSQTVKRGSLYLYETPGHDIPTEEPDDLAARIAEFCAGSEGLH